MLPTLIFVSLASLHTPTPAFASYVFTVPVRIETMTHITSASVVCALTHVSATAAPMHIGSGTGTVPIRDGSFTGNVAVTVVVDDSRAAAYPPTRYSCGLVYNWRNPDGTTYSASHILGEREAVYSRMTGQEISTATIEAAGPLPPG